MKITLYLPSGTEINTLTFAEGVHAGFPSPAADYNDKLDLGKELIKHPVFRGNHRIFFVIHYLQFITIKSLISVVYLGESFSCFNDHVLLMP